MKPFQQTSKLPLSFFSVAGEKTHDELISRARTAGQNFQGEKVTVQYSALVSEVMENCSVLIAKGDPFISMTDGAGVLSEFSAERRKKLELSDEESDAYKTRLRKGQRACAFQGHEDFGHTCPDFERILSVGISGIVKEAESLLKEQKSVEKKEFYQSVIRVWKSARSLALRMAQAGEKENDENLSVAAENLRFLADNPPKTFMQALQLIALYYELQQNIEDTPVRSLGKLDRLLYPYYCHDMEKSNKKEEDIEEEFSYFLRHIDSYKACANIPFALCETRKALPCENALTLILLRVTLRCRFSNIKIHLNYRADISDEVMLAACDAIRSGSNSLVFINSDITRRALEKIGIQREDAEDFNIVGCYEPCSREEIPCSCAGRLNFLKAVELAVNGGKDLLTGDSYATDTPDCEAITSFDELMDIVRIQLRAFAEGCIESAKEREKVQIYLHASPLLSATYRTSFYGGKDVYADYGAKYNNTSVCGMGIASAVDSLYAIKELIFNRKRMSLSDFVDILRKNWEGEEALRIYIKNRLPKYGNNVRKVDEIAENLVEYTANLINGKPNARGGVFRFALFSVDTRFVLGERTAASADGRLCGEPLSKNAGASSCADKSGLAAHMLSVLSYDHTCFPDGMVLDATLHSSTVSGEDGLKALNTAVITYLKKGGFALHINVLDAELLRKAQKNPELYSNLQVRLCGWNVLFSSLSRRDQDEFIAQAEAAQ